MKHLTPYLRGSPFAIFAIILCFVVAMALTTLAIAANSTQSPSNASVGNVIITESIGTAPVDQAAALENHLGNHQGGAVTVILKTCYDGATSGHSFDTRIQAPTATSYMGTEAGPMAVMASLEYNANQSVIFCKGNAAAFEDRTADSRSYPLKLPRQVVVNNSSASHPEYGALAVTTTNALENSAALVYLTVATEMEGLVLKLPIHGLQASASDINGEKVPNQSAAVVIIY